MFHKGLQHFTVAQSRIGRGTKIGASCKAGKLYTIKQYRGGAGIPQFPGQIDDVELGRFTTQYEQELYNIRTYLSKHSAKISVELKKLKDFTTFDTDAESINGLLLAIVMVMFLLPSYILNRRK